MPLGGRLEYNTTITLMHVTEVKAFVEVVISLAEETLGLVTYCICSVDTLASSKPPSMRILRYAPCHYISFLSMPYLSTCLQSNVLMRKRQSMKLEGRASV